MRQRSRGAANASPSHETSQLYRSLLGAEFDALHPNVQASLGAPLDAQGVATVVGASTPLGAAMARAFGLPAPSKDAPVVLRVRAASHGIEWRRSFGEQCVRTVQEQSGGCLIERAGAARIAYRVHRRGDGLVFESVGVSLFGLPVPPGVRLKSSAAVVPTREGWRVDVEVRAPWCGRLCAYTAWMKWTQRFSFCSCRRRWERSTPSTTTSTSCDCPTASTQLSNSACTPLAILRTPSSSALSDSQLGKELGHGFWLRCCSARSSSRFGTSSRRTRCGSSRPARGRLTRSWASCTAPFSPTSCRR